MFDTHEQVRYINTTIDNKIQSSQFDKRELSGLADYILTVVGGTEKKIPAIKTGNEFKAMVYNDAFDLSWYHRTRTVQIAPNLAVKSYGDNAYEYFIKVSNMSMIVFFNTENVSMNQDQLANAIALNMPINVQKSLLESGIEYVRFTTIGFDFDTLAIFRREMDGMQYDLDNKIMMIEVKYKIECSFSKACINNNF